MFESMSFAEVLTVTGVLLGFVASAVRLFDANKRNTKDIEGFKKTIIEHHERLNMLETKAGEIDDVKVGLNLLMRAVSALMEKELTGDTKALEQAKIELDSKKEIV